jgi:hypothetical protein
MHFDGFLDDVLVFDVAISKEHIAYLANKSGEPYHEAAKDASITSNVYFVVAVVSISLLGCAGLTIALASYSQATSAGDNDYGDYNEALLTGGAKELTPMERIRKRIHYPLQKLLGLRSCRGYGSEARANSCWHRLCSE